ncbi:MAG: TM2 domain-containing protein [Candidatus Brennerbacteria bacterium]|nr:TM2 domain-containing protein [Candidatus Brennerbacteria bacterium]
MEHRHEINASPKLRLAAALFCGFFGFLGVHRFYAGKIGTGILMILTVGGLGVWTFIDFIFIVLGKFRDKEGRLVTRWID